MRSQSAVYVDVGYLLAAAATRVSGTSLRAGIQVDYPQLAEALLRRAEEVSGLPALRANWYDSARNGIPDSTQEAIGMLPRVKLRLGRIGFNGEQKGVDLRIGLDMVAHARGRVTDVFVLVSGDDDLTEAVEEAQAQGVQVLVLAIPDRDGRPHGVSKHLQQAADAVELLDGAVVDEAVTRRILVEAQAPTTAPTPAILGGQRQAAATPASAAPAPSTVAAAMPARVPGPGTTTMPARPATSPVEVPVYSSTTGRAPTGTAQYLDDERLDAQIDAVCERVLAAWLRSATAAQRADLDAGRPSIPREVDRTLLIDLSDVRGEYDLNDGVRFRLRDRFWVVRDRMDAGARE